MASFFFGKWSRIRYKDIDVKRSHGFFKKNCMEEGNTVKPCPLFAFANVNQFDPCSSQGNVFQNLTSHFIELR